MTLWIRCPGPGQLRGEGEWLDRAVFPDTDEQIAQSALTGYLPTVESDEKPDDDAEDADAGLVPWLPGSDDAAA